MDQIGPILEMGITLKFNETNLFSVKLNYLYSVWALFWFSNQKRNILLTRLGHSKLKKLIKVNFSYIEDNESSATCPRDNWVIKNKRFESHPIKSHEILSFWRQWILIMLFFKQVFKAEFQSLPLSLNPRTRNQSKKA